MSTNDSQGVPEVKIATTDPKNEDYYLVTIKSILYEGCLKTADDIVFKVYLSPSPCIKSTISVPLLLLAPAVNSMSYEIKPA